MQREVARTGMIAMEPGLGSAAERAASGGRGKRQREAVWQNLLAIKDDVRVHRCTSRSLSCAGFTATSRGLMFEREQRLLDLVEA